MPCAENLHPILTLGLKNNWDLEKGEKCTQMYLSLMVYIIKARARTNVGFDTWEWRGSGENSSSTTIDKGSTRF